jgi:hypothetical protein
MCRGLVVAAFVPHGPLSMEAALLVFERIRSRPLLRSGMAAEYVMLHRLPAQFYAVALRLDMPMARAHLCLCARRFRRPAIRLAVSCIVVVPPWVTAMSTRRTKRM